MRNVSVFMLLFLALSVCAFADMTTTDPVFFCQNPASASCSGDPNIITSETSFGMFKNGSGTSTSPWDLLVAIPNFTGSAPIITSSVFTLSSTTDKGKFLSTTSGSIYDFTGLIGDSSMNATNMFGTAERTAFGGTPSYFEIFDYHFTPGFDSNVAYSFTVGGSGLPNGTFLAASGGSQPFSTPFTTTGLVDAPPGVPDGGMTLMLLGGALVGLATLRQRFRV